MTDTAPTHPPLTTQQIPDLRSLIGLTFADARERGILDWSGDGMPHALLNVHAHISALRGKTGPDRTRALCALTRTVLDVAQCTAPGLLLHLIEQQHPDAVLATGTTLTSVGTQDSSQDLLDWHSMASLSAVVWFPEDLPVPAGFDRPAQSDVLQPLANLTVCLARALALDGLDPQETLVASFN